MVMNPPDLDGRITELWDAIPTTIGTARADLLLELADRLMEAERHDEALPVLETAEELFVEHGPGWLAGRAAHNRGVVLGHLGRRDELLAAERESIQHYAEGQRHDLAGCSRMSLGFHLRAGGQIAEALASFLTAEADFRATGEQAHRANALLAVVESEVDLGRFPSAERRIHPTLAALASTAPVPSVARLHELAAQVFEVRRGPELALKALRNARAVWDALDEEGDVARCDIRTAVLTIGTDGPEAASTILQTLRLERQEAGDVPGVAACDRGLGLAALERNQPHQALRRFEDAAAVFHASALFADAVECNALAAEATAAVGRAEEARKALTRLLPSLARHHRPVAELRARLRLTELLLAAGDTRGALREAKRAESIARRGRMDHALDDARRLRAGAEARLLEMS
jgi:tetratricopeptide (TPR) repeat protein